MDFGVLSKYDDALASYFVDNLHLWFNTVRMNNDFQNETIVEKEIVDIIKADLFTKTMPDGLRSATSKILEIPYFENFTREFSKKQTTEFVQHLKRYLCMYAPNAGFEICSTTRYTGKMEACLVATKDWKAGDVVKFCMGAIAELSDEDDLKLKSEGRDFSVMFSFKRDCFCLFLGPARFMNHDCDANCQFMLVGHNAVTFKVLRDITCGEEMTVFYADHYFGEDNCECLCVTCERTRKGAFLVKESNDTVDEISAEAVGDDTSNIRRSGRAKKEISYTSYFLLKKQKHRKDGWQSFDDGIEQPQEPDILADLTNQMSRINLTQSEFIPDIPPSHCQNIDISNSIEHDSPEQNNSKLSALNRELAEEKDVMEWLENQSDLSEDDESKAPITNMSACCDRSNEFGELKPVNGRLLCGRCYRHYKIFGHQWPLRRNIHCRWKPKANKCAPLSPSTNTELDSMSQSSGTEPFTPKLKRGRKPKCAVVDEPKKEEKRKRGRKKLLKKEQVLSLPSPPPTSSPSPPPPPPPPPLPSQPQPPPVIQEPEPNVYVHFETIDSSIVDRTQKGEHLNVHRELVRLGGQSLHDEAINDMLGAPKGVRTRRMRGPELDEPLGEWVLVTYYDYDKLYAKAADDEEEHPQPIENTDQPVEEGLGQVCGSAEENDTKTVLEDQGANINNGLPEEDNLVVVQGDKAVVLLEEDKAVVLEEKNVVKLEENNAIVLEENNAITLEEDNAIVLEENDTIVLRDGNVILSEEGNAVALKEEKVAILEEDHSGQIASLNVQKNDIEVRAVEEDPSPLRKANPVEDDIDIENISLDTDAHSIEEQVDTDSQSTGGHTEPVVVVQIQTETKNSKLQVKQFKSRTKPKRRKRSVKPKSVSVREDYDVPVVPYNADSLSSISNMDIPMPQHFNERLLALQYSSVTPRKARLVPFDTSQQSIELKAEFLPETSAPFVKITETNSGLRKELKNLCDFNNPGIKESAIGERRKLRSMSTQPASSCVIENITIDHSMKENFIPRHSRRSPRLSLGEEFRPMQHQEQHVYKKRRASTDDTHIYNVIEPTVIIKQNFPFKRTCNKKTIA